MGNFCVGENGQETICGETTYIHEAVLNNCTICIIHGNILHQPNRGILNASIDPNSYSLMNLPEMMHEFLKMKIPVIQRLPPGACQPEFIINLKINYKDQRRELIEAYEQAIDLMYEHELENVGFREGRDKFTDKGELLNNCECLLEAIINKIKTNKMIKNFSIISADLMICQQYKNELKKCQHKFNSKSNFERCSTQEQLNESITDQCRALANSFDQTEPNFISKNSIKSQNKRSFPCIFQQQQQ